MIELDAGMWIDILTLILVAFVTAVLSFLWLAAGRARKKDAFERKRNEKLIEDNIEARRHIKTQLAAILRILEGEDERDTESDAG